MSQGDGAYRERTLTASDGLLLYFRDYGDPLAPGAPLVCLGGLTRNSKDFHTLALRLAPGRRVICPDYRGRGRSEYDSDWRHYRARTTLGDVIQLLAATNLHRAVICGTSFGGLLAMALAVAAPTTLAGVILNDIGPEVNSAGMSRIFTYIGQDRPQPDWDGAIAEMKSMFPDMAFQTEDGWREFAEGTFRRGEDGLLHFNWDIALAKAVAADRNEGQDLWSMYRALARVPTLALRGACSDVLSEKTFARMAREKPDLVPVTIPGVGHIPALTEPESETAIDDFLSRIDG